MSASGGGCVRLGSQKNSCLSNDLATIPSWWDRAVLSPFEGRIPATLSTLSRSSVVDRGPVPSKAVSKDGGIMIAQPMYPIDLIR